MATTRTEFLGELSAFSAASMKWCVAESEAATSSIMAIIDILLQDAKRVSRVSEETLATLKLVVEENKAPADLLDSNRRIVVITKALKHVMSEHKEIDGMLSPIVEALQFQDRIRQQMENLSKMIGTWIEYRDSGSNDFKAMGEKFLKQTTMTEERDVIRKAIPGLPEEEVVDEVTLF